MCSGIVAQEGRSPALVACQFRPTAERARTLRLVRSLPSAADSDYTPVSALLSGECTCLAADLSATLVTTLFLREDLDCAAVVDSSGRAIGTLSSREILRHHWQGAEPQRTVKDIMHPLAVRLTESTSADVALALMQRLRLPQALVVSQAGQPLGLLSVLDLASWLTRVPSQRAPAATT
jgi:predicted transcriptional regulator